MITTESNLCTPSILFEPDVKHDVIYQYYMNRMLSMIYRGFKVFYNRRHFLNFRRYLKNRLRAVRGPGGGSSWNLAFCGTKNVLQRLENIKCFWKKNPINFRVQISPRVKTMHNAWISPPNFFIEYFSLQTSAKIIHR